MADTPLITVWPILHYDDTEAALRFLVAGLGFQEALVARDDGGRIVHAELRWPAGGTILFGSTTHLGGVHEQLPRGGSAMYIPTNEVDTIFRRAVAQGAHLVQAPAHTRFGSGHDAYAATVRDLQGYLWTFGTYLGAP
jgi:uncharacterized glyoxalase superfamily protein PhnB